MALKSLRGRIFPGGGEFIVTTALSVDDWQPNEDAMRSLVRCPPVSTLTAAVIDGHRRGLRRDIFAYRS